MKALRDKSHLGCEIANGPWVRHPTMQEHQSSPDVGVTRSREPACALLG